MNDQLLAAPRRRRARRGLLALGIVAGLLLAGVLSIGDRLGWPVSTTLAGMADGARASWAALGGAGADAPPGRSASSPAGAADAAGVGAGTKPAGRHDLRPGAIYPALPGTDAALADAPLTISGSVLDDQGRLLPGITVRAHRADDQPDAEGAVDEAAGASAGMSQLSDDLGMFRFGPLQPGEYELAATGGEFLPARTRVRAGVSSAELRMQRLQNVRIAGVVRSEQGKPLAGATVRPLGKGSGATSDAGGNYALELALQKAGQAPVLRFSHAGFRDQQQRVEAALAADARPVRLDATLEALGTLTSVTGRITDERGQPVAGASAWLSSSSPKAWHRSQSNARGEFRFESVEAGYGYRLGVDAEGFAGHVSTPFLIGPAGERRSIVLEPMGFGSLSGQVVSSEGMAMPGFNVWLRNTDAGGTPAAIVTDAAGQFAVAHVPAGRLTLETRSQPQLQASGIELQPGQSRRITVPVDWGRHSLLGRVVDQRGGNVSSARLTLSWSAPAGELRSSSRRTASTDNEGYFAFTNLGPGSHVLTVDAPGFARVRSSHDPRTANGDLRIILKEGKQGSMTAAR